jgi:hypothetical protein
VEEDGGMEASGVGLELRRGVSGGPQTLELPLSHFVMQESDCHLALPSPLDVDCSSTRWTPPPEIRLRLRPKPRIHV